MAYLDMYNSEHKMSHHHHHHHRHNYNLNHYHNNHNHNNNQLMQVSPRISFSNDFVDAQQAMRQQDQATRASSSRAETASSDFEFSVTSYSMMSADELFFKGRLLPFKDNNNNLNGVVSRGGDGKDDTTSSSQRVTTLREELRQEEDDVTFRPAKGTRWKSLLGLKRAHSGSHSRKAENKAVLHEDAQVSKTSAQELMNEEMEIGI